MPNHIQYIQNKEYYKKKGLENYYKNKDKNLKNMKNWRKENPQKIKKYRIKYYQEYKNFLHELKINGCAICGYNKLDTYLHFHHANPEDRQFRIGLVSANRKKEKIFKELNKCILLCHSCHTGLENKNKRGTYYGKVRY